MKYRNCITFRLYLLSEKNGLLFAIITYYFLLFKIGNYFAKINTVKKVRISTLRIL